MASWLEIKYRYNKYLKSIEEADLIAINNESIDLPTKKSIQDEDVDFQISHTSVDGSRNLLLSVDDRRAGIRYLSPSKYGWLAVKLTEVLKANRSEDHDAFWWFTHDFLRAYNENTNLFPEELVDNLELLIRLMIVNPLIGQSPHHRQVNEVLWEANVLATYLAYPTLEALVKVACRRDIDISGKIRQGRKIRQLLPEHRREFKHHDDGNGTCSNLGMLMWHLETEVAGPRNQVLLRRMREEVGQIFDYPPDQIYGLINEFRNDSLHGQNRAPQEHGVLLNYACLVVWIILFP